MSDTIVAPEVIGTTIESINLDDALNPFKEPGNVGPNHKAHYVSMRDNPEFEARFGLMPPTELISTARFHQVQLIAMCGHTWIPELNPQSYPVCPPCADIAFDRLTS